MSRPTIPLLIATIVITASGAVSAAGSDPGQTWRSKVDPWVLDTGRTQQTEFLVLLAEQADLSAAADLPSKKAKGEFVYQTLSDIAARTQGQILGELRSRGVDHRAFWIANMIWVRGGMDTVQVMAERNDVAHIYANPAVRMDEPPAQPADDPGSPETVEWNIALVNADDVWATGTTGAGAVIAGQDTGYLWTHAALVNQYRGSPAGDHDYNWHDAIHSGGGSCGADSPVPCDDHGHGTHTMGTMVGDDGGSNQIGMAPGARWIGCRNMNVGVGTPATYAECYQWFIAPTDLTGQNPDPAMAPDVINNSWGCPPSEGCTDPNVLLTVVQNVRAAGIVTVHSAGNSGSSCGTVNEPAAIYDESFSVGATNSSDAIASFSSRGPVTIDGSNRLKPDISAPGVNIRSSTRDGGYQGGWDGTSMAGPHVAGLVALVISAAPGIAGDVDTIEDVIAQTAVHLTSSQGCGGVGPTEVPNNVFGWGRIDALAAVNHFLDFLVFVAPDNVAVCAPDGAVFDVRVEGFQSFAEPVTLSVAGLPPGASASFSNNPVVPTGASQLTVGDTASVTPGAYDFDVVGISSPSSIVQQGPATIAVFDLIPAAPVLLAPPDGALNQPLRPTFEWTETTQAGSFTLEVDDDPTFVGSTAFPGIGATTYTPSTDLSSNTRYFWRVIPENACGAGAASAPFELSTVALPGDCGIGTSPVSHFEEDFESGAPGWTHSGTGDTWAPSGARFHSGAFSYHALDPSTVSDQRLDSPPVILPGGAGPLTLEFWNWQLMEDKSGGCWDGGEVEISTNGGSTWTPLPNAVMLSEPYDGPVTGLGGLDGWCDDLGAASTVWKKAVVDISAYHGASARFRFRLGSDSSVSREGWYIDDLKVQSCIPSEPPLFADGFESSHTDAWSLTVP